MGFVFIRPESAEYDDLTADWLDGLNASDLRAAYLSGVVQRGVELVPGVPVTITLNIHGETWERQSARRDDWGVIGHATSIDRVPPIAPGPGEIQRAMRLAWLSERDGTSAIEKMQNHVMELLKAPIRIGELEPLATVIMPILDEALAVLETQHHPIDLLRAFRLAPDRDTLIEIMKNAGLIEAGTRGLRLVWTTIAFGAPYLLRPRPELTIVPSGPAG